jgi:hypothetical protein
MCPVVMSPNPKVVKKFLHGNGTVTEGTIDEALGGVNLGGTRPNKGVRRDEKELPTSPKKICLECSDPAVEGKDYCAFCAREMGK